MDVILHLGAHRTATTTFHYYLREHDCALAGAGIEVWEPRKTRNGLLTGVMPVAGRLSEADQMRRATGRIAMRLAKAEAQGMRAVVVSDENMIGAACKNLREGRLYGDIGARLARFGRAFGGRVTRAVLSVRAQDDYWSSVINYAVARGRPIPDARTLAWLAGAEPRWSDVIADLAGALPAAGIAVLPHAPFAARPDRKLAAMTGFEGLPTAKNTEALNATPELCKLHQIVALRGLDATKLPQGRGKWSPFSGDQRAALRECWHDDLYWLRAGADGLATLTEETGPEKTGAKPASGPTTRGQSNGIETRQLA